MNEVLFSKPTGRFYLVEESLINSNIKEVTSKAKCFYQAPLLPINESEKKRAYLEYMKLVYK